MQNDSALEVIKRFAQPLIRDKNHRYKSWEHCYLAFSSPEKNDDDLCLNLAFYLASWGMYRGSSGLLWKDYRVHKPVLDVLRKHKDLKNVIVSEVNIHNIIMLCNDIKNVYKNIEYKDSKHKEVRLVSPTDTLVSKIVLGTLGCLPAFDRYFNAGCFGNANATINELMLKELSMKTNLLLPELKDCQTFLAEKLSFKYPIMKIVDMYYWQLGVEK